MEQRLWMILQLFGGAALFLYSMDTLTDALQQAAGDTLRQALARLTAHPLAGVLTGAAVTAVVQSSSATIGVLQGVARFVGSYGCSGDTVSVIDIPAEVDGFIHRIVVIGQTSRYMADRHIIDTG